METLVYGATMLFHNHLEKLLGSKTKTSDIPAREQDLENTVERSGRGQDKENIMGRLRDLGYMQGFIFVFRRDYSLLWCGKLNYAPK